MFLLFLYLDGVMYVYVHVVKINAAQRLSTQCHVHV